VPDLKEGQLMDGSRKPSDLERLLAARNRVSRRGFLQATGYGSLAWFLAACERQLGQRPRATDEPVPRLTGELEDELVVYNWAAYLNPESIKAFEKETGVKVRATDFYESNEEMIAKLRGGATGYDLVAPTGGYVPAMAEEGLLRPLDLSRIPNIANVDQRFLGFPYDPDNRYHVPKDWGTTGIGYLTKFVEEDVTTWRQFYDLGEKYSGKYTVLDSQYEVIGSALKMLGYSYNSDDPAEVDQAVEELIPFKPHLGSITSSQYRQMMSRADIYLALGWNGDFFYVIEDQPSVKYVIPEEGTEYWIDTWAVPASAPHPVAAHEFINWILTPENQGRESNYTYYASCVTGAQEFTDRAIAGDPAIYPPAEVTDNLEFATTEPEVVQLRADAWNRFLAA
jgi:spermidine/putrescine transport system substrate-binding protein